MSAAQGPALNRSSLLGRCPDWPGGATLRGRVLDRDGRRRALLFAISKGGGRAVTEVDEDGTFELGGLAGGTWHVNATGSDGAEQGERLSAVVEGGEADVELRPKTGGGTLVVALEGAHASGCGGMLLLSPEAGARSVSPPPSARAKDGALTFRAVDPGRYTLVASRGAGKERAQASQPVDRPGPADPRARRASALNEPTTRAHVVFRV